MRQVFHDRVETHMKGLGTRQSWTLFVADIAVLAFALPSALLARFLSVPSWEVVRIHMWAFVCVAVIWVLVFFIAGLYEWRTYMVRRGMWERFAFSVGSVGAAGFTLFYLVPVFGITPKTLFIVYIAIVSLGTAAMRMYTGRHIPEKNKEHMICIGVGKDMDDIVNYVAHTPNAPFVCVARFGQNGDAMVANDIITCVHREHIGTIVMDLYGEATRSLAEHLYPLVLEGVRIVDTATVYEKLFERVPISAITRRWFLEHVDGRTSLGYEVGKRVMDICIAGGLFVLSLIVYPFVACAIYLEDGGPIFFRGERVGKDGTLFRLVKFRSMASSSQGSGVEKRPIITRVGNVLRETRIDELPQLWNVIRGDMSLVGPRPEYPNLVEEYTNAIPFYPVRHIVRPGLSGWAQLYQENHPHHGVEVEETQEKLSYDLYYIKRRSLIFDFDIALKTVRVLLGRKGR